MMEPVVIKVLQWLWEHSPQGFAPEDIAPQVRATVPQVNQALQELRRRDLVEEAEGKYSYRPSEARQRVAGALLAIYHRLTLKPRRELLVRGLLSQRVPLRVSVLLEVLEGEGFEREETLRFLEQEMQRGYLQRVRVLRLEPDIPAYPFARWLHPRFLEPEEYEHLRQVYRQRGIPFREEDCLLGNYPPEIALPARQYVEQEYAELRQQVVRRGWMW